MQSEKVKRFEEAFSKYMSPKKARVVLAKITMQEREFQEIEEGLAYDHVLRGKIDKNLRKKVLHVYALKHILECLNRCKYNP
mmetsp:Transcript_3558/g.5488  ORF Transcript_3558/g.5488 Transcript_3558/m.5488 type:complete len:82 (+) Transcript_3558:55-300(+)